MIYALSREVDKYNQKANFARVELRNISLLFRGRVGVGCLFLLCEAGGANPSVSNIVSPVSEECPASDIMRACMHRGVKDSQGPGEGLEIKVMMAER